MRDMTFTVMVYEAEEGGYWAEVAELPGCVSQGDTLDQLKENITEAIGACLQAKMEDEGQPEPSPVSTWTLHIPESELLPA